MSLWVDKYRPKTLAQLSYHDRISQNLKALSASGDFPHLLVYGPTGAGKKTRVYATLQEIFGSAVERLKIDVKTFTTSSNRKLEFNVISSPYHLEITPSDMGNNDRVVIQDLLKDVASTEQVDFTSSKVKHRFKVVVINEADCLSRDAQAALRRTMEKYSANTRLILVCNSISNIIPPIKSRTLLVRIPKPTIEEIGDILNMVAKKEQVKFNSNDPQAITSFLNNLAEKSDRNLRRSLLAFETISMQNETIPITNNSGPQLTLDWEIIISGIADAVLKSRSVATLAKLRDAYYELLAHCIPAKIILKTLLFNLIEKLGDSNVVPKLVELASDYDERLSLGQKSIFHLEGFTANAMVALES
ncbi:Replication factor C (RF-C) subunit [Scheffersomyces spartinae]|uniref:Replication factor C (RF-C) subunit n=1 Tax=Scheffersomyces spartinae TaxID=45513 RepID=A0A9P7V6A6_9ASCO|nr:Replication factor C (RF-C) subunit [Scheffersomyces spartinae]KAG7191926.1 Replication factor C (RF-C) subunit [Scheffersomyces spartinae]